MSNHKIYTGLMLKNEVILMTKQYSNDVKQTQFFNHMTTPQIIYKDSSDKNSSKKGVCVR